MKTFLITGGTDGIGGALARHFIKQGHIVIIIGRNAEKGQRFLGYAKNLGFTENAHYLQADLSLVSENKRALSEIKTRFPVIDVLILCAQYYSAKRYETSEGFEQTFALYYISRYLLSYGLRAQLETAANPLIVNVCAPGTAGTVHWDDLQLEKTAYKPMQAMLQGSRANDLLGVGLAINHPTSKIKYILYCPHNMIASSFTGEYGRIMQILHATLIRLLATPVEKGIEPIIAHIQNPPQQRISAFKGHKTVNLVGKNFGSQTAIRLYNETRIMLQEDEKQPS